MKYPFFDISPAHAHFDANQGCQAQSDGNRNVGSKVFKVKQLNAEDHQSQHYWRQRETSDSVGVFGYMSLCYLLLFLCRGRKEVAAIVSAMTIKVQ